MAQAILDAQVQFYLIMPTEHDIGSLSSILQAQGLTLVHITSHQSSKIKNTNKSNMEENHSGVQGNEIVAYTETSKDMKKTYTDVNAPPRNCSNKRLKTSMVSNTIALPQPDTVDSKSSYHTQELNYSKGESKSQTLQLSNCLPKQNHLSLEKTSTLRCEESKNAKYEKNVMKESSKENDNSFPSTESKMSNKKIDEKTVTVDLPLAGPFVHGYLSGKLIFCILFFLNGMILIYNLLLFFNRRGRSCGMLQWRL